MGGGVTGRFMREYRITRRLARQTLGAPRRCPRYRASGDNTPLARLLALYWGGRCYLCSGPVDTFTRVPHPFALTIDHIKPRAGGGRNSMGNLAPAQLACNMTKGDRTVPVTVAPPAGKLLEQRKQTRPSRRRRVYLPRRRRW